MTSHSQSHSIAQSLTTSENCELRMEKQACGDNNSYSNNGNTNNSDTTNRNNNSNINSNEN